jgi:uncharacterized linocin/CFP29 family protein
MDRNNSQLSWSDEQWTRVLKTVADEASRARVAASFLPLYGPVDAGTLGVPSFQISYQRDPEIPGGERQRLTVDSEPSTMLATIAVQVSLCNHEAHDPELNAALGMFRRAANVIARVEDALIFHGQMERGQPPAGGTGHLPRIFSVGGGHAQPGLLTALTRIPAAIDSAGPTAPAALQALTGRGDALVNSVVLAINQLEANGHVGPFACVLGHDLFATVCTPSAGLVLPRDRILPFLEGPLVRSSTIPADQGLVIALGGNPIELVVGSDISVRFLQMTPEPRFLFRVSERIALRAREWSAVAVLDPQAARVQVPDQPWEAPPAPARLKTVSAA